METPSAPVISPMPPPPARSRRRFWMRLAVGGGLLFVALILIVPPLAALTQLYVNAQAGRAELLKAKEAADRLALDEALAALDAAAYRFAVARHASTRLGVVGVLPFWKKDIAAVRDLLEGGHEAATALREAVAVGSDFLSVLRSGAEAAAALPDVSGDPRPLSDVARDEKRELLRKLSEAPDRLGHARASLGRALAAFDRVPRTPVTASVLDALEPQKARLAELHAYLDRDLSMLGDLPAIVGYPAPKTYLFLLLNNTELRPGGGFIGTYGVLSFADGEMESFFTDDIYNIDGPAEAFHKEEPPAPLKRWLRVPAWFMRDANWSPDVVVSGENAARLYRLEGGKAEFDGVIGVTPEVVSRLLRLVGPITIDGSTFSADNVTDELEYRVEMAFAENGIPVAQRKDIVGALGKELARRLFSLPLSRLPELGQLASDAIAEKHLMLSFKDAALMAGADRRGWTGRVPPPATGEDRLLVVDANLASLKTDPSIERTVRYRLRPDGESWIARAEITYVHRGRFNWKTTRYRTYARFYAPPGSRFLKGEGMMQDDRLNDPGRRPGTIDVGADLGHEVFGGFVSVEPGETRTLAVEYRVSDAVAAAIRQGAYRLRVLKQAGTIAHKLTLDLNFGKNLVRAAPPEAQAEWGNAAYRLDTDLRLDREFSIGLE